LRNERRHSKLEDTAREENLTPKHGPSNKTRIISGKRKKRYLDQQGNEINDPDLIDEIKRGAHVISYREDQLEI